MGTLVPGKGRRKGADNGNLRRRVADDEQRRAEGDLDGGGGEPEEGVIRQEGAKHRLQGTDYRKHRFLKG